MFNKLLFGLGLFLPMALHANLVDYTESSSSDQKAQKQVAPANQAGSNRSTSTARGIGIQYMTLSTGYESLEMKQGNAIEKYGLVHAGVYIQTGFDVFLDATYWYGLKGDGENSKGNPKVILGFNWLRLGGPSDEMTLSLFGGGKFSTTSELGSSRTDKIVGIDSTKRLGQFGVGLAYDYMMTGDPKKSDEMRIGNIQKFTFSLGWIVSHDIQFEVSAENFFVAKGKGSAGDKVLGEKSSFSTLGPKINLALSRSVGMELGARFRMKRAKEEHDLQAAKVFDNHSVLSNSIYAGLNVKI